MNLRIHEIAGTAAMPDSAEPGTRTRLVLLLQRPGNGAALSEIIRGGADCDLVAVSQATGFGKLVKSTRPDVIVLDLSFAAELAKEIDAIPAQRKDGKPVPVIGIAPRDLPPVPAELGMRVQTVLTLPFHRNRFLEVIKQWL